jgi:hypothetical protein
MVSLNFYLFVFEIFIQYPSILVLPFHYLKRLSHEMDLAFEDMHGQLWPK